MIIDHRLREAINGTPINNARYKSSKLNMQKIDPLENIRRDRWRVSKSLLLRFQPFLGISLLQQLCCLYQFISIYPITMIKTDRLIGLGVSVSDLIMKSQVRFPALSQL